MDLARPSNVGSLIGAVMVGLLALAANHYVQMDPQALQNLFARSIASDSSDDASASQKSDRRSASFWEKFWEPFGGANSRTPPPPEQVRQKILDRMKAIETHLLESNEKSKSVGGQLPAGKLATLIQWLDELHARLEADVDTSGQQQKEARLSRLYGHFLAAEMAPSSFSQTFLKIAEEGTKGPDETEASHATALKLLHELDPRHPSAVELLKELEDFSRRFPVSDVGIYLYSIVSRELWQHGRRDLARDVLRLGVASYKDQPGIKSRLMNQLLNLENLS